MSLLKTISFSLVLLCLVACQGTDKTEQNLPDVRASSAEAVTVGAERFESYMPLLRGKSVALVANATSMVEDKHLVDVLLEKDVQLKKVFAPEHGFRGQKDAGETINDEVDEKTGLPIHSLYGSQKKPSADLLKGVDVMVFDIQDVGVRFYTYLSTLHYVMESCAKNDIPLIVLDRPNPNGFYVDGPVLEPEFASFIGLHPVPLVYGMTIGEYGQMINGEGWLSNSAKCDLTVIKIANYSHASKYALPVKPSPNLPNMQSVYLYPSLALFEGTIVSIGRGTDFPFQVIGHPDYQSGAFSFTPRPVAGAMSPKLDGQLSRGVDLRRTDAAINAHEAQLELDWIIDFYETLPDKDAFFLSNNFFNKLAGNDLLMKQIKSGLSAEAIRASWQADLADFKAVREHYLLYK
ncbi:MAG: exo-beta-N-acetylmuramidase NamZ family protein [Alphaproteobacteria bacterium]